MNRALNAQRLAEAQLLEARTAAERGPGTAVTVPDLRAEFGRASASVMGLSGGALVVSPPG